MRFIQVNSSLNIFLNCTSFLEERQSLQFMREKMVKRLLNNFCPCVSPRDPLKHPCLSGRFSGEGEPVPQALGS